MIQITIFSHPECKEIAKFIFPDNQDYNAWDAVRSFTRTWKGSPISVLVEPIKS